MSPCEVGEKRAKTIIFSCHALSLRVLSCRAPWLHARPSCRVLSNRAQPLLRAPALRVLSRRVLL